MLILAFFAIVQNVTEPRAASLSDVIGARIGGLRETYLMLPTSQRLEYLREVARRSDGALVLDDPNRWGLLEPEAPIVGLVVRELRAGLPHDVVGYSAGDAPQLWFSLPAGDGDLYWMRMPVNSEPDDAISLVVSYLGGLLVVVVLGMLYLGWRSRDEIQDAGRALGILGALAGPEAPARAADAPPTAPELPPGRTLDELVATMSSRLVQMRVERAEVLRESAAQLRAALLPWTGSRSALAGDGRAAALVMQLERVAAQFERFAQDWSAEAAVSVDLGALVTRVVEEEAPGITLALAPLPPLQLRPQAMEQLLSQLLNNAMSHGDGRVVVTAAQEGNEVVLRVLDRGDPLEDPTLDMIGRPFLRGMAARHEGLGAGLGFPLARQLAQLHEGQLRAQRRIGGGMAVELRLPVAEADTLPAPGSRSGGLGRQRPAWVGVLGDVLLLAALFAGAIILSAQIFSRFILPGYVEGGAAILVSEVKAIRGAYEALPTALRPMYEEALRRYSDGRVRFADPAGRPLGEPILPTFQQVLRRVRERMPGETVMVDPWPSSTMWFGPPPNERVQWLAVKGRPFSSSMLPVLGGMALLVVACAGFLVLRARRRLGRLAQGVVQSTAQWQRHASTLGGDEATVRQALELKRRFDHLSENLAQAKDDQELLLRNLASDLRDHLHALREAARRVPLAVEPLDDVARAIGRLDHLAHRGIDANLPMAHVNQVLTALSTDATVAIRRPVRWVLGGVPYAVLSSDEARWLLTAVLGFLLGKGRGEMEVQSTYEHGWVTVRCLDRVPGCTVDEVEAGLAIPRQDIEMRGGFLRVSAMEGGGLQVAVQMPPARLG